MGTAPQNTPHRREYETSLHRAREEVRLIYRLVHQDIARVKKGCPSLRAKPLKISSLASNHSWRALVDAPPHGEPEIVKDQ